MLLVLNPGVAKSTELPHVVPVASVARMKRMFWVGPLA
jgi:hypothetical protein